MSNQAAIIDAARSWIGTPFHLGQRCRGAGVDCVGFVISVAGQCGIHIIDKLSYRNQPLRYLAKDRLEYELEEQGFTRPGQPGTSDIVVIHIDNRRRTAHHLAFLDWTRHNRASVIHTNSRLGMVCEQPLMMWRHGIKGYWRLPGMGGA